MSEYFSSFFGRYTCQAMLEENHSAHKLQKHSYICHSDTCRQNEHGLSHYQAFIEASCQVETHKSLLQMLQTISINSQSEGNRMSASISIRGKENIYGVSIQTEFLIISLLFHKVLVHWVQLEFTICCQSCQWTDLTILLICSYSEQKSGCPSSKTFLQ